MKQSRDKLVCVHADVKIGYLNGLRISSENLITMCGLLLVLLKSWMNNALQISYDLTLTKDIFH